MSADKRAVSTDALETLGTILDENAKRDAIHLGVEPVIAGEDLCAGQSVGFLKDGTVGYSSSPVGIVDPFILGIVSKGQRFWLVVYPRKITSLRHVWEHPDFPDSKQPESKDKIVYPESEKYLQSLAENLDRSYESLMSNAAQYLIDNNHYWTGGSEFEGMGTGDVFWEHYQRVTGQTVPTEKRGSFLNCAC